MKKTMRNETQQLKLEEIKVQSFVTNMDLERAETIRGGIGDTTDINTKGGQGICAPPDGFALGTIIGCAFTLGSG